MGSMKDLATELGIDYGKPEDPNAWTVGTVDHITSGETMGDDGTGDEWIVERVNVTMPWAKVVTTYGVVATAFDDDGTRIDSLDEAATIRYAVSEVTELLVSDTPADWWAGTVGEMGRECGEGSLFDYATEEEADRECEAMARRDASMTGVVTWDGQRVAR